jgi:hypothetical protein
MIFLQLSRVGAYVYGNTPNLLDVGVQKLDRDKVSTRMQEFLIIEWSAFLSSSQG